MPSQLGWIWPKDPRRGNPTHWRRRWRLKDVLTNHGPDIFVGRIGAAAPDETNWSRWRQREGESAEKGKGRCAGAGAGRDGGGGYYYEEDDERDGDDTPFPWARRSPGERYDFRTRKYQVPDVGTWSKVQRCGCEGHVVPLRFWDRYGAEYPADRQHDLVYRKRRWL
ncbi:hypothetical protein P170DRAFT_474190 [Aspergillus steynii IBT 23096]|uniref:Uncharacterized protein n=1 Tax=Aspergillus steynii IBT 23096 TaxID=1392250 RepID=A0A2I2GCN0_9EURO|nr:uncharacterized protein P170DRAFT_474190 [Aspergillus steynii IBT 23096]PLB50630.1 hypothetical protein P170DRAFT_474190 [Aspergillus steynii IBT 23096]